MLLAQDSVTAIDALAWWHAIIPLAAPIVLGLAVGEETRGAIKKALPAVTGILTAIVTAFINSAVGAEVLLIIPLVTTAAHHAYKLWGAIVSLLKAEDLSLNDVLGPEFSLRKIITKAMLNA